MIWAVAILLLVLLAAAQRRWAPETLRKLQVHGRCSAVLAQPGETIFWDVTVENRSRLPAMFVRLRMDFPTSTRLEASPQWQKAHCSRTLRAQHVEQKLSVGPNRSHTRRIAFSVGERGQYSLGDCTVSAGDLLGFREAAKRVEGEQLVVMPRCARSCRTLQAVGGFLGDISVRRFILEDPVLTVGFRDYTGREPMKSISWTRTAMTGKLQVRQFDHTAEQTVVVLLDVEDGTSEQLEGCFRQVRTVCQELERRKIPYGLRTNGDLPGPVGKLFYLAEGLGDSHLNTILYSLGRAGYTRYRSLRYLVEQTLLHRKSNEAYILVTPEAGAQVQPYITRLENAVGSALCVLTGQEEVEAS